MRQACLNIIKIWKNQTRKKKRQKQEPANQKSGHAKAAWQPSSIAKLANSMGITLAKFKSDAKLFAAIRSFIWHWHHTARPPLVKINKIINYQMLLADLSQQLLLLLFGV